jgi:hypothetical protein
MHQGECLCGKVKFQITQKITDIVMCHCRIFALDVPEVMQAKDLVEQLDDSVSFYKIGMELLMTGQYFQLMVNGAWGKPISGINLRGN